MTPYSDALWLTASPALKKFDQRLLCQLNRFVSIRRWEYHQTVDEPCCLETPVNLLHDYMKTCDRPLHILGHGLSGIIGLAYAQRFPHRVRSLTLLSVDAIPTINWHAHYYALRQLLPCSRDIVLAQMAKLLFGPRSYELTKILVDVLKRDLDTGLALHSLVSHHDLSPMVIQPPVLVCYGGHDDVLSQPIHERWQPYLKPTDALWQCVDGRHFFHFDHPKAVVKAIRQYWQQQDNHTVPSTALLSAKTNHQ